MEAGVDYWRALKRREAGMSEEKIFATGYVRSQKVTPTAMTVHGVFYPSIRAACAALSPPASETTIERWIKSGTAPEAAFMRVPNPGYRNGIIYSVTHRATGKRYVGLTVQSLERRWKYHQEQAAAGHIKGEASLHAAIREHGAEAFEVCQIDGGTTKLDLEAKERRWIAALGTLAPHGFNLDPGGVSGGSNARPVVLDGVKYGSVGEAALAVQAMYGVTEAAAKKRIAKGRVHIRKPARPGESLVKTKEYKAWSSIVYGLLRPGSKSYVGDLGMEPAWRDFAAFHAEVGNAPGPEYCFARKDKKQGFYRSNCCWMTKSEASRINFAYMKAAGRLTGRPKKR